MKYRVVVTGMGVVSPLGNSIAEFSRGLFAGKSGVARISLFDPAELPVQIAAEVKTPVTGGHRDRKIGFAREAARQAVGQSGITELHAGSDANRSGVSLGIGLEVFDMSDLVSMRSGVVAPDSLDFADRLCFLQTPSDLCVHVLAKEFNFSAVPSALVSACAAGTDAIGTAFRMVRSGRRKRMLCGGTDSMINPLGVGGFCKLRALSTRNDAPEAASRPFDVDRDGFVLGEGAGVLVLERLEDALARDATIHAEIVGYGSSLDAHGISEPHPAGRGAVDAMRGAIEDAGATPESIDCINAHGSSTPKNDVMETLAIRTLFKDHAERIAVVSTKSMIGHLIAASGAVEVIAGIICLQHQTVHPTINLDSPDPQCDLDYVADGPREFRHDTVLCNSFGFGGQNASLLLRRWES
ncbi:MAG: beta-ketoacyl-[acyl-carrier-protein] synthase family protein [Planctomycetales bacterium]|nr:beta-ketoacyl-[acyl-carrier-protein] synthase family protein [Planctomycetales bacterium]